MAMGRGAPVDRDCAIGRLKRMAESGSTEVWVSVQKLCRMRPVLNSGWLSLMRATGTGPAKWRGGGGGGMFLDGVPARRVEYELGSVDLWLAHTRRVGVGMGRWSGGRGNNPSSRTGKDPSARASHASRHRRPRRRGPYRRPRRRGPRAVPVRQPLLQTRDLQSVSFASTSAEANGCKESEGGAVKILNVTSRL
jgi:hypothetical protein